MQFLMSKKEIRVNYVNMHNNVFSV